MVIISKVFLPEKSLADSLSFLKTVKCESVQGFLVCRRSSTVLSAQTALEACQRRGKRERGLGTLSLKRDCAYFFKLWISGDKLAPYASS